MTAACASSPTNGNCAMLVIALQLLALSATIHTFDIELADSDRGRYESLVLRVARHPSESAEYLVARVLAYLLEYTEGIAFSRGVSDAEEPAIIVRDLTGVITTWIEIGTPDAARLHKASKAAGRVVVYIHRDPSQYLKQLAGSKIQRSERVELFECDRPLIAAFAARLERRLQLHLSVTGHELYLSVGEELITGRMRRVPVP
jgi:uncharacterized protein YaeQ